MTIINTRHAVAVAAAAVLAANAAGCGGGPAEPADPIVVSSPAPAAETFPADRARAAEAREELLTYFRERAHGSPGSSLPWYDDVTDLLPNIEFETPEGTDPISAAVVHGRIVDVRPNSGYTVDERREPPKVVALEFDDPSASWADANLIVEVLEEIGPGRPVADTIEVRIPLNTPGDLALIRPGFVMLESVVLFLRAGGPAPAFEDSDFRIVNNGELLTEVIDGERLSLPWTAEAASPESADALLSRAPTLSALRAAAALPGEIRQPPTGGPGRKGG